ncbi:MAG: GNAT family N-acetyltransferase [Hellea sp.]|nr:GNAT family N-acetyltransferase [Hellea sp.]
MILRPAKPSDANNLAAVGAATFTSAFGHLYQPEDLSHFLNSSHSLAAYQAALESDNQPIWVIEDQDRLVAYIKLCPNRLPCDPAMPEAVELSRLYALADYRGRGLGSRLLDAAYAYAKEQGSRDMVLSVFSENFDGHRFYERHGFKKIGEYDFAVGAQLDREWIMHRKI